MIIALVLAAAPVAAAAPSPDQVRFDACVALAQNAPAQALEQAGAWRVSGGGLLARHCEALAYVAQSRWAPAATAFEAAARAADTQADARASNFWVQAGNAALAGGEPARARAAFDAAIARAQLNGSELGEVHLDRARALVAANDLRGARGDLDTALRLVPADPLAWLLSATQARRTGDLTRARADIAEAGKRSPDDAAVALEAGNIAVLSGSDSAARTAWEAAVRNAPASPAGKAAADALTRLAQAR